MTLKQLLYPPRCPFCGRILAQEGACEDCLKKACELTASICKRCGADLEHCSCYGRSFAFQRNVSAFLYEHSVRNLVLRFKQRRKPQLAKFMSRRMYYHVMARLGTEFSAVTYVPQTKKKSMSRGYCPAKLLAEELAELLKVDCVKVLSRCGGREQKYVSGKERWENAKRNYKRMKGTTIHGKVLLVDDLITTGATLNACSALLLEAGADEVYCATFAIAAKNS